MGKLYRRLTVWQSSGYAGRMPATAVAAESSPEPLFSGPDKIRAVLTAVIGVGLVLMSVDILTGGRLSAPLRKAGHGLPAAD